ncbi:site-specific integrase [Rufibacter quisquiliarum]|uniref:Integrase n=1 Tax=Rufibacter quisquiliarum TaxID=1549639 RepID=A0A839GLV7_9BACT|nr:site-specific integrase [Rufibacter quisquiliarum]MBA9076565.1 integrase [Rufibacter quisquiliarum]
MASIKIILRNKSNAQGEHALALQIIKDRKTSIMHTGHHVLKKDWDEVNQRVRKSHPNSARLNNLLAKKLAEANDKLLELETNSKDGSARTIQKAVKGTKEGTFFKQAEIYLSNLEKEGKFNRLSNDKPKVNRLREFLGGDVNFSELDTETLKRFKAWLKGSKKVTERTAVNYFVVIRSIFNQAIAANVADRKHYPFGKGKIVIKFPDSAKLGLNMDEIKALEEVQLKAADNHARNLWLLSFYMAGMRVSDVLRLRWSDIHDGRMHYSMGKNDKSGSLKIPEKALQLLEQYRRDSVLVFPDLEIVENLSDKYSVQHRIKSRLHNINNRLEAVALKAGITKPLTMHIARHSFAQIASDKVPVQILQKLYRHSSITTTIGYQSNFTTKHTDDALDSVLAF